MIPTPLLDSTIFPCIERPKTLRPCGRPEPSPNARSSGTTSPSVAKPRLFGWSSHRPIGHRSLARRRRPDRCSVGCRSSWNILKLRPFRGSAVPGRTEERSQSEKAGSPGSPEPIRTWRQSGDFGAKSGVKPTGSWGQLLGGECATAAVGQVL